MTSFTDFSVELREPAPTVIAQLRRLTGLTWEQLAYLFGVSRQSVHFWASGGTMTAAHRLHLERVIDHHQQCGVLGEAFDQHRGALLIAGNELVPPPAGGRFHVR